MISATLLFHSTFFHASAPYSHIRDSMDGVYQLDISHLQAGASANCLHVNGSNGRFQNFLHYTHTAEGVNRLIIVFYGTLANEFLFFNKTLQEQGNLGYYILDINAMKNCHFHGHHKGAEQYT